MRALGFPVLEVGGVEADDVIGTLAERGKEAGLDVLVSTGDKDMAQLVDDHVTMVNTMDGAVLDAAGVEAKFGVPPESIVDYLTLVGDTVDNVPGVPKVGPKTAVKWLTQYRTVEDVVERADEIKGQGRRKPPRKPRADTALEGARDDPSRTCPSMSVRSTSSSSSRIRRR